MTSPNHLTVLREFIATAPFNVLHRIEVTNAAFGEAELSMPWHPEAGQYFGFLHAGLIGGLIDTSCGCAAGTVVAGRILAAHYAVNCLRPAIGETFSARARVVKAGKNQVFTAASLFGVTGGKETLVATGETIFAVVPSQSEA